MANKKFVLSIYLILIFLISFSLESGHALEEAHAAETLFQSVHVSSFQTPSVCQSASSSDGMTSLQVLHRHGPCNGGESNPLRWDQIISLDQSRVASIQARYTTSSSSPPPPSNTNLMDGSDIRDGSKNTLPAQSGIAVGTANYIVNVGLGTPKQNNTLLFDTGSALTWAQCEPCLKFCYAQFNPIYDPSKSSTYSNFSCGSKQCAQLIPTTGNEPGCYGGSNCVYRIDYGDNSFSVGFFAKETLRLGSQQIPGFLFGCGQNNQGLYGNTDGLLGLSRDNISVVYQTARKYGKVFSYCLPTWSGSNGYLSFGKARSWRGVKFTPLSSSLPEFYYITIEAISVGGIKLPINISVFQTTPTVIDSGTVITRLPPDAYSALRAAFQQQMSNYTMAPAYEILDTCYDFSNLTNVNVPSISFFFKGRDVAVVIGPSSVLAAVSISQVCLAFAGNSAASELGIFGNYQQQTFKVVYDVAGGKLGFQAGGCS